ncbi:MAG: hypothetical protein R3C04_01990 [Hyphomonas sp.]
MTLGKYPALPPADTSGHELLLLKGNGCVVQVRCTGMSLLAMEPVKMGFLIEGGASRN